MHPPVEYAAADPPALRLAVAGDVGTGEAAELATAKAVTAAAARRPFDGWSCSATTSTRTETRPGWAPTVFEPFGPVLSQGTRLLPVLGNHDVEGQVAPLGMPGRWYAKALGPVLFIGLDSTKTDDPAQRAWLERTLSAATEPWKVVALHHPPYSAGQHGSSQNVRDAFGRLFERYGVQLVLAGHDHDYQRTTPINGVTYVVSGGAAKLRKTGSADDTAVSRSTYHFVDLVVWPDRLLIQAVGQDGLVLDSATIPRP